MRSRLVRYSLAAGALAGAGLLAAGPATAHGAPFTLSAGSAPVGTSVAFTGTATAAIAFKDVTTGVAFYCASSVLSGFASTGSSSGSPVAAMNGGSVQFGTATAPCTGPLGLKYAIMGSGIWNLNATDVASGVTTGTLTNIRMHVTAVAGPACVFDLGAATSSTGFSSSGSATVDPGSVNVSYSNAGQSLALGAAGSNLGMWNVNPSASTHQCISGSWFKQGDRFAVSGTYEVQADGAADNPIAIS